MLARLACSRKAAAAAASVVVGLLACRAAGHGVRPTEVSFPTSDGGVVHAEVRGRGPCTVVLAHGGRFTKESWSDEARALAAAGFRVLALDFRGRGRSRGGPGPTAAEDVHLDVVAAVEHARATGAETVAVVGASFGGWAAARAAVEHPDAIDRLVLLAAGVEEPERLTVPTLFLLALDDVRGEGVPRLPEIRAQYERVAGPKELVLVDGSAHAQFLFATDEGARVLAEIVRFLRAP